jgi:voltage-gated potassium channel
MAQIASVLVRQRRFQQLFAGLLVLAMILGVLIVPVESDSPGAVITNEFDGIWWAVTTVTSVGYGDMVPVTVLGKMMGMVLQVTGVLAFGLLVSMVTVALDDVKEKYYRQRLDERLEQIDTKLERIEKQESFMVRERLESGGNRQI